MLLGGGLLSPSAFLVKTCNLQTDVIMGGYPGYLHGKWLKGPVEFSDPSLQVPFSIYERGS